MLPWKSVLNMICMISVPFSLCFVNARFEGKRCSNHGEGDRHRTQVPQVCRDLAGRETTNLEQNQDVASLWIGHRLPRLRYPHHSLQFKKVSK